eukprot:3493859-Prymnesium_polylepis.1
MAVVYYGSVSWVADARLPLAIELRGAARVDSTRVHAHIKGLPQASVAHTANGVAYVLQGRLVAP